MKEDRSTIAAIATPYGAGGIGIVKISGPSAVSIARKIFRAKKPAEFKSHRLYLGEIFSPKDRRVIDEALVTVMKAPKSYTGEDVVEIQAHSGTVLMKKILGLVCENGARIAGPGEFTKRAFINGRIDLTQAEAVVDLIQGKSRAAIENAAEQMRGLMKEKIQKCAETLQEIAAEIEAQIDFIDDDVDANDDTAGLVNTLKVQVFEPLKKMLGNYEYGCMIKEGLGITIAGKPNVGKSSLMNRLLGKDRVIISEMPGTTRDVIEEVVYVDNLALSISDTAGMHSSGDSVENAGIKKSIESIKAADLILFVVDMSQDIDDDDIRVYETIRQKPIIIVMNKVDKVKTDGCFDPPMEWLRWPAIKVSALMGEGMDALNAVLMQHCLGESKEIENGLIPNLRQKEAIEEAIEALDAAMGGIEQRMPLEIIAIDVRNAIDALGKVTGAVSSEEILNRIFSRFCIGK